MKKQSKGITLVALIVTIVILLILAGISIASLTGNGLFGKAKLAKEKQKNAQIEEGNILTDYENRMDEYIVDETKRDSTNKVSNINIYIDECKSETIPERNSKYIYTYYTSTDNDATIEFDKEKWGINIYNIKNDKVQFNLYFYEKDKMEVLLNLLNINKKYNSIQELYKDKLQEILNNKLAYDYIIDSEGNLAKELTKFLDSGEYTKSTFQAYVDGLNSHSLNLSSGKYILKFSCNMSFELKEVFIDEYKVEPIIDNIYLVDIKSVIKFDWYCNHMGSYKFLYLEYKEI